MKELKISKEVIASLMPTRNLLNLPAIDLNDQTFTLNSVVDDEAYNEKEGTVEGAVRLRYMNTKNNSIATFPIRGLLYAAAADVKDSKGYDAENTKTIPVHTKLLEKAANEESIEIPQKFTIVDVQTRTSNDKTVFPTYSYQKFQDRVAGVTDQAEILKVYQDFTFMRSLPGSPLHADFKDVEPVKDIVISLD